MAARQTRAGAAEPASRADAPSSPNPSVKTLWNAMRREAGEITAAAAAEDELDPNCIHAH